MYIKGVGMTKFGVEDRTTQEMAYEAALEALDDADMSIDDVDAVVVSNEDTRNNGERQRLAPSIIASIFKIKLPMIRVPAVCGGGGAAFWTALKLGYDNVLVVGAERLAATNTVRVTDDILMAADRVWEQSEGLIFPAQNALVAQQHMLKYGTTTDDFAMVALKNHENAYLNPKAGFYGKKVTLEDIKKSPVVASPLRLFDCSYNVNGAAACIITKDIDFAEVHDAFTPVEIINYEDLGFCRKGEGAKMIREGVTKLDGRLPVNTSGGLKAKGHPISATGISQIYEIVKQMRNECGERQLKNNRRALAQNIGGAGSTVSVHIFERVGG